MRTDNFITDASLILEAKRMILGGGPITAHEVNEHISVESYDTLVEHYKKIFTKFVNK